MSPTPAYLDDFSTDNSSHWAINYWAPDSGTHPFGDNHYAVTGGELEVACRAGATHEFDTIAAADHTFADLSHVNITAVKVVGWTHASGIIGASVGLTSLDTNDEVVASVQPFDSGVLLGLCLGTSPDLTSTLIDIPDDTDGFPEAGTPPFWLALLLNGPDTMAALYVSDPMADSPPAPFATLKWSDYAVAQGQPADMTATLAPQEVVPQLGFWLDSLSSGDGVILDNWEAGFIATRTSSSITVGANPHSIPADGTSQSDVTAYVRDHTGAGMAGLDVTFTPASHFGGAVTDNGDGTYDAAYTSDTNPGSVEVMARTGSLNATTAIQQRPPGDIHAGPSQVGIVRVGAVHS